LIHRFCSIKVNLQSFHRVAERNGFSMTLKLVPETIPVENINPSNPVSEYGVDSHVAVELRNWVSRSNLPAESIADYYGGLIHRFCSIKVNLQSFHRVAERSILPIRSLSMELTHMWLWSCATGYQDP
jgi:hypothetical protein